MVGALVLLVPLVYLVLTLVQLQGGALRCLRSPCGAQAAPSSSAPSRASSMAGRMAVRYGW
ncbi:hypothetical protein ATL40_1470 [Serinibacter salmoneus]|uniref:Uncharacterized protein n=1 Tax=Serinibacter salmoneus TaxID=556530 RepID=A0A2A9CZS3_9MICO|nr:hypothetical protein ATL40_1470 [Serinibacter salmoneus]